MNFIRFHSLSFGGGPGYEIHSGRIQDPRSKIAEGSFPVILDPGRARMKTNEIIRAGFWIQDYWERPLSNLGSWILEPARMNFIRFHAVSF